MKWSRLRLSTVSAHVGIDRFENEIDTVISELNTLGAQFAVVPWLKPEARPPTKDAALALAGKLNGYAEACRAGGLRFGYHNHEFEFSEKLNGQILYDIIMKNTDPALVIHQLDIGNMYNANAKAADVIKKYPGRFESMHVKDEIKATGKEERQQYESTLLGKGVINVKEVLELGKKSGGTKHFIIEQESYQGQKPLDAMRENIAIMKKWGY